MYWENMGIYLYDFLFYVKQRIKKLNSGSASNNKLPAAFFIIEKNVSLNKRKTFLACETEM